MSTNTLTHDEVCAIAGRNFHYLKQKHRDHLRYKLQQNTSDDYAQEAVSNVIIAMLSRHFDGLLSFESEAKVNGYVLQGARFNYRTSQINGTKKTKPTAEERDQELFELEGNQRHGIWNPRLKPVAVSLDMIAEVAANDDHRDETDQDLRDAYYSELWSKLFTYLDDCIGDDVFTFAEVNTYKQYILNSWTMKRLVQESDFKKAFVYDAVKRIKDHLKTVHWFISNPND